MGHYAGSTPTDLEQLAAKLVELERRVSVLEHKERVPEPEAGLLAASPLSETSRQEAAISTQSEGLVAIVGRAILGMGGAYLLRAAAEAEMVPKLLVVAAALLYAWGWQLFSARSGRSSRLAGGVYGITAALILFPMVSELTLRYQILPAFATAGVLVAAVASALLLAHHPDSAVALWTTTIFASGTALGLLVATRDPLPFLLALFLIAALTEFATYRQQWAGLGIVPAILLDLALCSLLYLATQRGGFPQGYKPVSIPISLVLFALPFLLIMASVIYRTIRLRTQITLVDVFQTFVTFSLLLLAVLELAGNMEAKAIGLFCSLATAACYFAASDNREGETNSRNDLFYQTWAGALLLVSSYLALPLRILIPWLNLCAVLATFVAIRTKRLSLGLHGLAWLISAQFTSGLMTYAAHLFAGAYPLNAPSFLWLSVLSATVCSLILLFRTKETRGTHLLRSCSVANTAFLVGALGISGVVTAFDGGMRTSAPQLAFTRSIVTCVVTLVIALVGARSEHRELFWVSYAAIGLGALKLLLEDLRFGSTASFAFSLVAFGILLAVIPRLVRDTIRAKEIVIR